MDIVKIEHGVPIPPKWNSIENQFKKAMKKMRIGDSFVVSVQKESTIQVAAKALKIKMTRRKVGHGIIRVWRIG